VSRRLATQFTPPAAQPPPHRITGTLMRWLIVFVLACLVFNHLQSWLERIGLGRVPGDFTVTVAGRKLYLPIGSSLLLTLLMNVLMRWL
jgi:hypothetical protein